VTTGIPTGGYDNEVQAGEDKNELPAITTRVKGFHRLLANFEGVEPPLVSIFAVRRLFSGRFPDPIFTDDLFSLPASLVQHDGADFGHVARTQIETASSMNGAIRKSPLPGRVGDAERLKKVGLGKFICGDPRGFADDFTERDGNGAIIGEFRARCSDNGTVKEKAHGIIGVIHPVTIIARISDGNFVLVPGQASRHGKKVSQTDFVFARRLREEGGDFFVHAANQVLIDGDADEDGTHTFRRGLQRMECVAVMGLILTVPVRFLFEGLSNDWLDSGRILLEDEFIASDQKDAVDVCISVSIDAI